VIRQATAEDVPRMVALSDQRRTAYQQYQPTFWRKAADANEKQRAFFEALLERADYLALVYEGDDEIDGFVIAGFIAAPPVYDPAGATCLIDDFAVSHTRLWATAGRALLDAASAWARENGAAQMVVITGHHDKLKRKMLADRPYSIASEWWVSDI
jgi:GNAT superfamily N-acetyltransferase